MKPQPFSAKIVTVFGAALMLAIALGVILPNPYPFIGAQLYDVYAHALFLEGRFDLPAREVRVEGHYTADGTAYLYHGLGPLLTRIPFLPFVDLPTGWLSGASIWFWAVLGNLAWHGAFWLAWSENGGADHPKSDLVALLLAFAVWFAAPGLILVASGTLFNEAISMAYALAGGFFLLLARVTFGLTTLGRALIPLAVLAGLMVHARPHLAVGLYLALGLLALAVLRETGMREWKRIAGAGTILAAFGLVLIASNAARFDDAARMHGSFQDKSLQYGMVFWGVENPDGKRAQSFEEHGRFNVGRILPNALLYVIQPPSEFGMDPAVEAVDELHAQMVAPFGYVRVEEAKVGTLWLWPLWMALMAVGLAQRRLWQVPAIAGLVGIGVGALLLFSYPTINLRYHVDIWPLIAFPALFGLAALARLTGDDAAQSGIGRAAPALLAVLLLAGFVVTSHKTLHSRVTLVEPPGTLDARWSDEQCLELIAPQGFAPERAREICGIGKEGARG